MERDDLQRQYEECEREAALLGQQIAALQEKRNSVLTKKFAAASAILAAEMVEQLSANTVQWINKTPSSKQTRQFFAQFKNIPATSQGEYRIKLDIADANAKPGKRWAVVQVYITDLGSMRHEILRPHNNTQSIFEAANEIVLKCMRRLANQKMSNPHAKKNTHAI